MKILYSLLFLFSFSSLAANPVVVIDTNFGKVEVELDEKKAPETVKNFLVYVDARFYDGTIFHRVIDNFMIQGGGFLPGMKEKTNKRPPIKNEAKNGLKNDVGTIAMARTNDPHSATAQFFINVNDNDFLNHKSETTSGWGYAVFGKVTSGMHVVNRIKKVRTGNMAGHANVPMDEVLIKSIRRK
ncbi:MAG TPA: peptidylprolyl isomerase [Bacteriovoracaceae bacterium]|nr:peptidylprolyl isomerase [Bacteriovoracaceae bacterium]